MVMVVLLTFLLLLGSRAALQGRFALPSHWQIHQPIPRPLMRTSVIMWLMGVSLHGLVFHVVQGPKVCLCFRVGH